MATTAEQTVAQLEQTLEQASADLAKVKRAANVVTAIALGGGVLYVAWKLFHRKSEAAHE